MRRKRNSVQSLSGKIFTPYSREVFLGKMEIKCRSRWKRNVWHNGSLYMGKGLLILLRGNVTLKKIQGVKIYCIEKTENVQTVFKHFRVKTNEGKKKKRLYKITEYIMKRKKKIQVRVPYDEKVANELCTDEVWDFQAGTNKRLKNKKIQDQPRWENIS
ncbi:hypothetical protein M514_03499 [Trichuris suis]|uniref:Uncharacterized protein n=1 Tax=Trichuris suis TaxID=68888 RepID=A0A085MEV5_9BILA|nr:hypothetical protein M513_03499 [Trichuris suis]KFD67560.1 hypothetical protein M514_03499 [Trichuris suis]